MTRFDPNRGAPNAVLLIVAWLRAAWPLLLRGLLLLALGFAIGLVAGLLIWGGAG